LKIVFNPAYVEGEMLSSFQAGLESLGGAARGVLVALGDQPQIEAEVVRAVVEAYRSAWSPLVIPSVRMRRGHPWLIDRSLWPEVLALHSPQTLRDFQQAQAGQIRYVSVETESILLDLDTPEDYRRARGG
jgi:molybdenum cofactor cytidylyltransferase